MSDTLRSMDRRARIRRLAAYAGGGGLFTLIAPNVLSAPLSLSRAQVSSFSTAVSSDGATWREFPADTPRFNGADRRLAIGGQRTNLVSAARTWANMGSGITVTAAAGPDGLPASAFRWDEGTGTSTHSANVGAVSCTLGQTYVLGVLVRPGTCTAIQVLFSSAAFGLNAWGNFDLTVAGGLGSVGAAVTRHAIRRVGEWYWCELAAPATATAASNSTVLMANATTMARNGSYAGTNRTLDVSWAQVEEATFASMFILPPVGAPAATTRGTDIITAPLSSLGIPASGACTIIGTAMIPVLPAFGTLVQVDDGTVDNRFVASTAGANAGITRTLSAAGSNAIGGTVTAGVPFRWGMAIDGAGRAAFSLNGAAAVAVTGGPTGGLTTFRVGAHVSGAAPLFGEMGLLQTMPFPLSDADLVARVAALTL